MTEPALQTTADAALLRRVLENLLENALRHTPTGGKVGIMGRKRAGVEITVSNTGAPIPNDARERIFDKFYRGHGPQSGAAGLGLYFCKRVIEAHGGRIEARDIEGWPTSFSIHLPGR
jgi:signal transduction histidine kinase